MDYMTTKETAAEWKVSDRRVLQYCNTGRIIGAEKMGNTWLIQKGAEKPADRRYKDNVGETTKQKEGAIQ